MSGTFTDVLHDSDQIDITVTGRVSGREISVPVWFVTDEEKVYLVPVRGSDSDWYRNVRATPRLQLAADGASITAAATTITDPARVRNVVETFRSKYGPDQVAAYYPKPDVAVEISLPHEAGAH